MDFHNYILTVQTEALKTIVKKGVQIGMQADDENRVVLLTDPLKQSAFCIPDRLFLLRAEHMDFEQMSTLKEMFDAAKTNGRNIELTDDMYQANKSIQLRKLRDPENNVELWVNSKFLGYFKGIKGLRYNWFEYRGNKMVMAYLTGSFEILGVTITMKPKREAQA